MISEYRCVCTLLIVPAMQRPPDPQLLGFLEGYDRHISDLALALREVILEEAPDASESIYEVYTVAIWFGFSGKMKDMFCKLIGCRFLDHFAPTRGGSTSSRRFWQQSTRL